MRYTLLTLFFFVCTQSADAHLPVLVEQKSLHDIERIDEPEISRAFYGELTGDFPHTYEIRATEPFHLLVELLVPDIESSKNNVRAIVIKEAEKRGRVEDVARLHAKDATWESFFEYFGGDSYRRGPSFERDVEAGVYRIEVSTPDNLEKYVLVVGQEETWGGVGYFEMIGRIMAVKEFFGKSKFFVIASPLVFVPLILIALVFFGVWFKRRKNNSETP